MTLEKIQLLVDDIPSFITEGAINCYYKYANLINKGEILDIGTGWGKSLVALAKSNPSNHVVSVDPGYSPVGNSWASDLIDYEKKIKKLLKVKKVSNVTFIRNDIESVIGNYPDETFDILHLDNWPEINGVDSTDMFRRWFKKVKKGGYILARNYGHASRLPYTYSLDKATFTYKKIEMMEMIQVYQV